MLSSFQPIVPSPSAVGSGGYTNDNGKAFSNSNSNSNSGASVAAPLVATASGRESNYHDYANIPEAAIAASAEGTIGSPQPSFPVKLHYMLESVEAEGLAHIVSWESHSRCFKIYDQKRFADEILPRFFRQSQYASFQRQLNLYEFRRLTIGRDRGAYYHERFLRWRPVLADTMKRTKLKGQGPRKPAQPQTEPNFYTMPPVRPQPQVEAAPAPSAPAAEATLPPPQAAAAPVALAPMSAPQQAMSLSSLDNTNNYSGLSTSDLLSQLTQGLYQQQQQQQAPSFQTGMAPASSGCNGSATSAFSMPNNTTAQQNQQPQGGGGQGSTGDFRVPEVLWMSLFAASNTGGANTTTTNLAQNPNTCSSFQQQQQQQQPWTTMDSSPWTTWGQQVSTSTSSTPPPPPAPAPLDLSAWLAGAVGNTTTTNNNGGVSSASCSTNTSSTPSEPNTSLNLAAFLVDQYRGNKFPNNNGIEQQLWGSNQYSS